MKIGLVLAGGGGKGGYQIGVWKYLKEIGLEKNISVISGTSVGGLNAVLMGCVDYEIAEKIWTTEIDDKILDTTSQSRKDGALFSRTGLLQIIDEYVNLSNIKTSGKQIYVTCYNTDGLVAEYFNLNKYESDDIKKFLCATSAIPIAFQNEKISGKKYIDGGVKDNVPLRPLLQEKCTHALVVNLGDEHEDYSGFEIKTIVLHPSSNLGNLFSGTMDFSLENATKRINIGYNDCKNIYPLKIKTLLEDFMNKDEFVKKADEINIMNDNTVLLETLKMLTLNPSNARFLHCKENILPNKRTMGGKVFYKNISEYNNWKVNELKNECEAKAKYSQKI